MSVDHPAWPMSNLLGQPVAFEDEVWILTNCLRAGDGFAVQLFRSDRGLRKAYVHGVLPHVTEEIALRALESEFSVEYLALQEGGRQYGEALSRAWIRKANRKTR